MKRIYKDRAALLNANKEFAGVDLKHYDRLKELLAANILHSTDHKDCHPLNDMYRSVSNGTKEIIRLAINTINKHFGADVPIKDVPFLLFDFKSNFSEEGPNKGMPTFYFRKEIKQNGESIAIYSDEKGNPIKEARSKVWSAISAVDEKTLARLIDEDQQRRNETAFVPYDWDGQLINQIKKAARVHGTDKSNLVALNSMIKNKERRLNIDELWNNGAEPLEALKKEIAEKQALLEKAEKAQKPVEEIANDDRQEKPAKVAEHA